MPTCFVMQPFDSGKFDKRFDDVFSPAIRAAGFEPYRVDRDAGVSIPIDEIEAGIDNADICLAEITTDNPNVWFELGYAIAANKDVVLICSDERETNFPFDVRHRTITIYATDSPQDFKNLTNAIERRITALVKRRDQLGQLNTVSSVGKVEGLDQHEVATLVAVAESVDSPSDGLSAFVIRQAMEKAGFTGVATTIGLKHLLDLKMITSFDDEDFNGVTYTSYRLSDRGFEWLADNQEKLVLRRDVRYSRKATLEEEDIPF